MQNVPTYSEVILEASFSGCSCPSESKHTRRSTRGSDPKGTSPKFPRIEPEQPSISPDASQWGSG